MFSKDDVASPAYRATLQKRYESKGWGASGAGHWFTVANFAYTQGATSILDYGCGRGTLKPALIENAEGLTDVREYDPGIIGKDELPEPADLVVCTDVLEHIEPALLDNVLAHIRSLANRGVYFVIGMGPAKEVLPDGRNAHLIQRDVEWWRQKLIGADFVIMHEERRKGYNVWAKVF